MARPIAVVTTSPYQLHLFLRSHLAALPADQPVLIFSNTEDQYSHMIGEMDVRHLPLSRTPRITGADLTAARRLRRELRAGEVETVLTVSPKGGFVGQLAALGAGVPNRVHLFTGQVWEGMERGTKRTLVKGADMAIGRMATHLAADSPSQAQSLRDARVAPRRRTVTVPHAPGSIRGVDLGRFHPDPMARASFRLQHDIPGDAFCFVQVGRLAEAKGVFELGQAFARLRADWLAGSVRTEPRLVFLGQDEDGASQTLASIDGVHVLAFDPHPERVLAGADVLVLASHREGFGSTIIEAAATGIPAIGTNIVGVRDAITPTTGWLVPRQDPDRLHAAMAHAIAHPSETLALGAAALTRAIAEFDSRDVEAAYARYFMAVHHGEI